MSRPPPRVPNLPKVRTEARSRPAALINSIKRRFLASEAPNDATRPADSAGLADLELVGGLANKSP